MSASQHSASGKETERFVCPVIGDISHHWGVLGGETDGYCQFTR